MICSTKNGATIFKKRKYLLVLALVHFYFLNISFAQHPIIISGFVVDTDLRAIKDCAVLAYDKAGGTMLGFDISKSEGSFKIELPFVADSVFITANHLSYDPFESKYKIGNQINIQLQGRITPLPEVVVKVPPFEQRGDTLIFNVKSYQKPGDKSIEDVLKRIPGVEVSSNGKIFYDGLDISKFYIQGLDLLEGQYSIASRNLQPEAISEIQILQRHQYIKSLDSIYDPDNAAINLKLKRNFAMIGKAEIGGGIPQIPYLVSSNLFGFQKHFQFALQASANSVGLQRSMDLQNHFDNTQLSREFVSTTRSTPSILLNNRDFWFNNEKLMGYNFLKKINEDTQLKLYGNYTSDIDQLKSLVNESYNIYGTTTTFNKVLSNTLRPAQIMPGAILEINKSKFFFKNKSDLKFHKAKDQSNHLINDVSVEEKLNKKSIRFNSDNEIIFRIGQKAYSVVSNWTLNETSDSFNVSPNNLILPNFITFSSPSAIQLVDSWSLNGKTFTGFFLKKGNKLSKTELVYEVNNSSLFSRLSSSNSNNFPSSEDSIIFSNDTRQQSHLYQAISTLKIGGQYLSWDMNVRGGINKIRTINDHKSLTTVSFIPVYTINSGLDFNQKNNFLSLDMGIGKNIEQSKFYYDEFILHSYQSLETSRSSPVQIDYKLIKLEYSSKNYENNQHFRVETELRHNINNQVYDLNFTSNGFFSNNQEGRYKQLRFNSLVQFEKDLGLHLSTKVTISYSSTRSDIEVNDRSNTLISRFALLRGRFMWANRVFRLSISPELQLWNSNFIDPINLLSVPLNFYTSLPYHWSIEGQISPFKTISKDFVKTQALGEITARKKWQSKNISLELRVSNLFAEQYFYDFNIIGFSSILTRTRMRPAQVFLSVKKEF
ncbi:MAG: hypothetical protein KDC49_09745 [Saprospiraceae bacterium]|nr:hypothetical protein [Saprospiraceae bacterium]